LALGLLKKKKERNGKEENSRNEKTKNRIAKENKSDIHNKKRR